MNPVHNQSNRLEYTNIIRRAMTSRLWRWTAGMLLLAALGSSSSLHGNSTTTFEPVNITTQPASLAVCVGVTADFSVTATGTGPLTYQWYLNSSTLLAGKTSSSLTILNAQPATLVIIPCRGERGQCCFQLRGHPHGESSPDSGREF